VVVLVSAPHVDRVQRLEDEGPRVGCTWGGRARPWGPPVKPLRSGPTVCPAPARWLAVDDGNDVGWFLCDPHLLAIKRRRT
jgi:hypothetical protein